jgi:hypothetical protein
MSETGLSLPIPENVKTLAEAYSRYIEVTNRAWLAASTVGLISVILSGRQGNIQYAELEIDFRSFLWLAIAICSAISIHYSSCQMMCYQFSKDFAQVLHDMKAESLLVTKNTNLKDLAYKMVMPNYVRIFPLTLGMNKYIAKFLMICVKPILDVSYSTIPLICLIILSQRVTKEIKYSPVQTLAEFSLVLVIWLIFFLAIFSLLVLIIRQITFQQTLSKFTYK